MQQRSRWGGPFAAAALAVTVALTCGGCGWRPWRVVLKHRVRVLVHEAYGDASGYHLAGTLTYVGRREPVADRGPVSLEVTLGPAAKSVATDDDGRFELAFTPADFKRRALPGGDADLVFRLARGEDRRLGIRFPDAGEQRDLVHISGEGGDWAVVVILHDLPMAAGGGGWSAPPARAAGKTAPLGSPRHIKRVLSFLRGEAGARPPAVVYLLNTPGADCGQIFSFLDIHRLPRGGMITRSAADVPIQSPDGVDPYRIAALHRLNRKIPGRKWVVLGRLGTGDGPTLFEGKAELGRRLAGGYLMARREEPWPKGLRELIVLTSIKRMDSLNVLARDLQEAGRLPLEAVGRAQRFEW